jgi:hypothetical protein
MSAKRISELPSIERFKSIDDYERQNNEMSIFGKGEYGIADLYLMLRVLERQVKELETKLENK